MNEVLPFTALKEKYRPGGIVEVKRTITYSEGLYLVVPTVWGDLICIGEGNKELEFADTDRRNSLPKGIYIVIGYADNSLSIESLSPDATKPELVRGFVLQKVDWDGEKVIDYHEFYFLEIRKDRKFPKVIGKIVI